MTELKGLEKPTEEQKTELALLQQALESIQKTAAEQAQADELRRRAMDAPARLKEIQTELAVPLEEAVPPVPTDAALTDLDAKLRDARAQLEAAEKAKTDRETEFDQLQKRPGQLGPETTEATQALDDTKESLALPPDPKVPEAVAKALQFQLKARQQELEARLFRLKQESQNYDTRLELRRARRDQAQRQLIILQRQVKALGETVEAKKATAAEETSRQAELARRAAANADPVVQDILEENQRLAKQNEEIANQNAAFSSRLEEIQKTYERWKGEFDSLRKREGELGLDGLRLRSLATQLPSLSALERERRKASRDIAQAQAQRFDLDSAGFVDMSEQVEDELRKSTAEGSGREMVKLAVTQALTDQRQIIDTLNQTYSAYIVDRLLPLRRTLEQLIELTRTLETFIDERVLWIQSDPPLQIQELGGVAKSFRHVLAPSSWQNVAESLWNDFRSNPLILGGAVLLVGGLITLRRRVRQGLQDLGAQVRRASTDRFGLTVNALVLTLLLALPGSLLLWVVAWRLHVASDASSFALAAGAAFKRIGTVLLLVEFIRELCRQGGVGDVHFGWRAANLARVRRNLSWLIPVGLPLGLFMNLGLLLPGQIGDAVGRLALMVGSVVFSVFFFRVFHPDRGIFATILRANNGGWLQKLRYVWFVLLVAAPLILSGAAGFGYVYSAISLLQRLINSLAVLVLLYIVRTLILRGLLVAARRLAIDQARKKRTAQLKAQEEAAARATEAEGQAGGSTEVPPVNLEQVVDVAAVSEQTRRLVQSAYFLTVAVLLGLTWKDVFPAFNVLRNVVLWSDIVTTGDTVATVPVTLFNVLVSLFVVVATVAVSKNIPGLLEIAILQRLPITAGARYAVTTLVRYCIVIVGMALAFSAIGIGWQKVQWLAAAVTVGLGFGLQEIFANFVSGLIILFERPIRVGDTVTVGTTSGTVTQIRMRATTITDWDRKELIIPNKEFITGQIVNWSLTDAVLRLTIPVGIAYGSDTARARQLLLQVAQANTRVLKDPSPQALFLGFGDSSLDFQLRVFLPNIDHFVPARHELHEAVDSAFRKAKIEIAFPQRDLHIRSIEAPISVESQAERVSLAESS